MLSAAGAGTLPGQTYTTLYSLSCTAALCADGESPDAPLVQATDGNLYGLTYNGGTANAGVLFKITPAGAFTPLNAFDGTDGSYPTGLVQAANGSFYGTAPAGGTHSGGTVFKMTADGALTALRSFVEANGRFPTGALVQGADGSLYGTTLAGGANCLPTGCGTIFKITPGGKLTTLYSFCSAGRVRRRQQPTWSVGSGHGWKLLRSHRGPGTGRCDGLQNDPGRHVDHDLQRLFPRRLRIAP